MIREELNLFKLMQQIRKLKAGMCERIGDDEQKIESIEERYMQYSTIEAVEKTNCHDFSNHRDFRHFLDRDEREHFIK